MGRFDENIADSSVWITATPTGLAKKLPFYVYESGRFTAFSDYKIKRDTLDSFLLIYTIRGKGQVKSENQTVELCGTECVIIDCHMPHEYFSLTEKWEFYWVHFNGSGALPVFEAIYPDNIIKAVKIRNYESFEADVSELVMKINQTDTIGSMRISKQMHEIVSTVCVAALEEDKLVKENEENIEIAVRYIEKHYSEPICLDDIIKSIHVSKYHFIRQFKRAVGITPYSYLTNYRINISKTLLRTTKKSVAEIAQKCGFSDTSNFITHFKNHTGQKPLQYRRDFSI